MKYTFVSTLLIFFIANGLFAQKDGVNNFMIRNYSDKEIGIPLVNWKIQEGNNGIIYFGNSDGLLEYDGIEWRKLSNLVITSIAIDSTGTLYYGTTGDFGYLSSSVNGKLKFHSLKYLLKDKLDLVSQIWDIETASDGVYFSSKQGIFRWDGAKIKLWPSMKGSDYSVRMENEKGIYTLKNNLGLIKLNDKKEELIEGTETVSNDILAYLKKAEDGFIIGTRYKGIYQLKNGELNNLDTLNNNFLSEHQISTTLIPFSSRFYVGTYNGGIGTLDNNYHFITSTDITSGLQSNSVKDIKLDTQQNLWCALQEGISMIEVASPFDLWDKEDGLKGLPWSIKKLKDQVYVGTNKGLFYFENNIFNRVEGINTRIWSLTSTEITDNSHILIAATDEGVYTITSQNKITLLSSLKEHPSTNVMSLKNFLGKIAVNCTSKISIFSLGNNSFSERIITSFDNKDQVFSSSTEDVHENIWLGAKNKGIYKISNFNSEEPIIKLYDDKSDLSGIVEPSLVSLGTKLLVGTEDGLFEYNSNSDSFNRKNTIEGNINKLEKVNDSTVYAAIKKEDGYLQIEKIIFGKDGSIQHTTTPYKRIITKTILSIYSEENYTWFATSEGLYRFDESAEKDYAIPYNTLIRKVNTGDSLIFGGTYSQIIDSTKSIIVTEQPVSYRPILSYDHNTVRFEYAATFYELPEKNEYSYILEGNDKTWSNWSTEHKKEYNNLSAGKYTFKVKSKNIYDFEGNTAVYKFTILPPWYQTYWAYGFFAMGSSFFIWFIVMAYSYRVRQQRAKLKLIVADRTFEVLTQKKEIEKQNELLKDQNEEIAQQRDNINEKNQELEMSQEEILSINDKLQELNTLLEKKVEKRTSKIKSTLLQLQQTNAELDTFIYRASHDLKGPISRIHGLTSLAKLESTSPNDLKYYELIELVAKDMHKLLAKLTQVHEVIHSDIEKEMIDLPVLISDVRNSITFLDKNNDTKYSFELENTLQIKTDAFLFSIILTNLMENAVIFKKTTTNSTHQILIKTSQDDENYYLQIRDTGLGISDEHVAKVFNMFFRGSDQSKGSGLGLYLARLAVDKLKGNITVESQFNEFSSFLITLPK